MAGEMVVGERAVLADRVAAQATPRASSSAGPGVTAPVASFQAWLASVDVEALSDRERVDLVAVLERVKGSASATQARATHALRCSRELVAPRTSHGPWAPRWPWPGVSHPRSVTGSSA